MIKLTEVVPPANRDGKTTYEPMYIRPSCIMVVTTLCDEDGSPRPFTAVICGDDLSGTFNVTETAEEIVAMMAGV